MERHVKTEASAQVSAVPQKNSSMFGPICQAVPGEDRILYVAACSLLEGKYTTDRHSRMIVKLRAEDVNGCFGEKDRPSYSDMRLMADSMTSMKILTEDEERHSFTYTVVINEAVYADGELTVAFSSSIKDVLAELKKEIAMFPALAVKRFRHPQTFPLYRHLKEAWSTAVKHGDGNMDEAVHETTVPRLKVAAGLVDTDSMRAKKHFQKHGRPCSDKDYEKAVEKLGTTQSFGRGEFEEYICQAVSEINEVSDLAVSYQAKKESEDGDVPEVKFIIRRKTGWQNRDSLFV